MEAPRGGRNWVRFVGGILLWFLRPGPENWVRLVSLAASRRNWVREREGRDRAGGRPAQRPGSVDWGVGMDEFHFFPVTSVAEIRKDLLETNGLFEKHRRSCGGLLQRPQKARVDAACNREQIARATLTCPQVSRLLDQAIPGK